jgi:hypothetical protein
MVSATRRVLRRVGIIPITLAVMAIAAGGAYATSQALSANSGTVVTASSPNASALGTGEALTIGASDAVSVGLDDTNDIPFAPGYATWRKSEVSEQLDSNPGNPPAGSGFMTVSALRWQVAEAASCSWADYWLASTSQGNDGAASTAAAELEAAPSWSAITDMTSEASGLGPLATAVSQEDTQLVTALIDTGSFGNCSAVGPFFPPAGMTAQEAQAKLSAARTTGQAILAHDSLARTLGLSTS